MPSGAYWTEYTPGPRPLYYDRLMIEVSGTVRSLRGWSEETGLAPDVIYSRLVHLFWRPLDALTVPEGAQLGVPEALIREFNRWLSGTLGYMSAEGE